jgi:hypothetical protein
VWVWSWRPPHSETLVAVPLEGGSGRRRNGKGTAGTLEEVPCVRTAFKESA